METHSGNTDNMVDTFYDVVYSVCDKYIPKKNIKPKSNTYPHWFSLDEYQKIRIHRFYKRFNLENDFIKFAILIYTVKKLPEYIT